MDTSLALAAVIAARHRQTLDVLKEIAPERAVALEASWTEELQKASEAVGPAPASHASRTLTTPSGDQVDVDEGMVAFVRELWRLGIPTSSCCQGGLGSSDDPFDPDHPAHVSFFHVDHALAFLQLADGPKPTHVAWSGPDSDGFNDSLHARMMGSNFFEPEREWEYSAFLECEGENNADDSGMRLDGYTLSILVYLPPEDVARVAANLAAQPPLAKPFAW
ncbi:MAG: hypothetical protein RKU31_33105 [Deltaproteobacteria bacterium]|jgi:hypothetical protein